MADRAAARSDDGQAARRDGQAARRDGHEEGSVRLFYPEYGPVDAVLGFGLFYVLVDRLTPAAVAAFAAPFPDLAPDALTTAAAAALWLVAGLTAATQVWTQVRPNPRTFADATGRDAFLEAHRPDARHYRRALLVLVLGGAVVALAWDAALATLGALLPLLADPGGPIPATLTAEGGLVTGLFFVGFAALARGLDRLAVGLLREFLYRAYAADG